VLRVSNRIGIAEGDDPERVEAQLCAALPKPMWTLASDVQILHGRRICRPKPLCDQCMVRDDCDYYHHVIARERTGRSIAKASKAATTRVETASRSRKAVAPEPSAAAKKKSRRPGKAKHDPRPVRTPRR
jgi:adenine-specific DNA glycosylase